MSEPTPVIERVAAVLDGHKRLSRGPGSGCLCGWSPAMARFPILHSTHVAQQLARLGLLAADGGDDT